MPTSKPESAANGDTLVILVPVYNDWPALSLLLGELDRVLTKHRIEANVLIVDDGSAEEAEHALPTSPRTALRRLDVLRLRRNLGHQRAIAIGLAYVEDNLACTAVVLMDADGEDDPEDVPRLIEKYRQAGGRKIIFAERTKRSESWVFLILYTLYRLLHYLLTGRGVRVGNFSIIPHPCLCCLVVVSEMWNHYAAAVFKSRLPFALVPTRRGKRLAGSSTMRFVGLVTHGLSAISVYADLVGVRLLVAASAMILLAGLGIAAAIVVRLVTDLAIPGWATYTVGLLLLMLLQAIMFAFVFCFIILGSRQGSAFVPIRDYGYFVGSVKTLAQKGENEK